jgi:hypothetical protein
LNVTVEQVRRWREHGWVLLTGLVPSDEIDAAMDDVWELVPRPEEWRAADGDAADDRRLATFRAATHRPAGDRYPERDERGPAFRNDQFLGRQVFPFPGSGALNRLVVHDRILDVAEQVLGSTDLRLYQMSLWAKYAGLTDYEQPMHRDRNHSVVPFRAEPGWWHLEGFLYLTDVDEDCAPTRIVDLGDSDGIDALSPLGPDQAPSLYRAEQSAAGPRGSFLAYRPDVFHRGVDLTRRDGSRVLLNISYRLAGHDWIGFESHMPRVTTPGFVEFAERCSPRQLAALGVPAPGHAYWTTEMLAEMHRSYPALDLTPWYEALGPDQS